MNNYYLFDGAQKSTPINELPASAWTWYTPHVDEDNPTEKLYKTVPWLFRATDLRANGVRSIPFSILNRAGDEIDNSADWQNVVGFLDDPGSLLYLVEAALTLMGRAYVFRYRNRVKTLNLRYLLPTSITPLYAEEADKARGIEKGQVVGFARQVGAKSYTLDVDDVLYFWRMDPFKEYGPSDKCPAAAALHAAGVLASVDEFAKAYFKRGAVKVTLLTTEGSPSVEARKELQSWWQKAATGIQNAFAQRIIQASVKPVVIGEGIQELSNTTLTGEKREDIATALGVPQTKLWSTQASGLGGAGVVTQDDLAFYNETIIPESRFIEGVFNRQLFANTPWRFKFRPETLDIFQADEHERSGSLLNLTNAGVDVVLAMQMLGFELPTGYTWEKLEAERQAEKERKEQAASAFQANLQSREPEPEEDEARRAILADLRLWRKKALKRGGPCEFESEHIPAGMAKVVMDAMEQYGPEQAFSFLKQADLSGVESALKEDVTKLLAKWQPKLVLVIERNGDTEEMLLEMQKELQALLGPRISMIVTDEGLRNAVEMGVAFDPASVSAEALSWARQYTYDLVTGLTETTRRVVKESMTSFLSTPGMTRGDLEALLQPAFGEYRASMIAVTETTRASNQATLMYQQQIGAETGLNMVRIWRTANDELVCPICGPLNGQPEEVWAKDFPQGPPAHVNCRCSTTLTWRPPDGNR